MMTMNQPLYIHDCEYCVYFKTDKDDFGTIADIYICDQCVTFRYSNDISDNRSICFKNKGEQYIKAYQDIYSILQEFNSLK
jgi:hypothetical protein